MNPNDDIFAAMDRGLAGGSKSAFTSDSLPGDTITGAVVSVDYKQVNDFNTGEPAFFPSGDPKMQFVIVIQTDQRDDEDDDGRRTIYIPAWGSKKQALVDAMRAEGMRKASEAFATGNIFTATFVEELQKQNPQTRARYREKVYTYRIQRGSLAAADRDVDPWATTQQAPAPAPAPAPQQAPAPQPAPAAPAPAAPQAPAMQAGPIELIRAGLDDQQIATATGLPAATIASIRKGLAG
jgi:hypothetical protein